MENKKNNEQLADGDGKLAHGWICAKCGKEVSAARAKDGKAYCIPCYNELFGDPTA